MSTPQHIRILTLPLEEAHGGAGARRLVLQKGEKVSPNLEAMTNGFLPAGGRFDWHKHEEVDEIMICLAGNGKIEFETGEVYFFGERDLVYIPKGNAHAISSPDVATEFFFFRLA